MSHNDITGDKIATKTISKSYRDNYDAIFGKGLKGSIAVASTTDPLPPPVKRCAHVWVSTCQLPPGPTKCMHCGMFMRDIPVAELGLIPK